MTLARRSPLRRASRLPAKRTTARRSGRVEAPAYLRFVRPRAPRRETAGGTQVRRHDAVPLCAACHAAYHAASGPFRGMDQAERRDWCEQAIRYTRAEYQAQIAVV
jgi:hypothetical protein